MPDRDGQAARSLGLLGRLGLAGRTGFYLILTAITVRIALFGGEDGHGARQADANGALMLIARSWLGRVAIGAVALGFVLFGAGRLVGACRDVTVSALRRVLTALQGLFYAGLAYIPCAFLAGQHQTGSQQQQQKTTADLLNLPGGRGLVIATGVAMIIVCAQQINGAVTHAFADGLDLAGSPRWVRRVALLSGTMGISARALVFLPVGIFLIVAAAQYNPGHSYGTDAELLRLSGYRWGRAVLATVALGLGLFVVFSAVETRYRTIVSAR